MTYLVHIYRSVLYLRNIYPYFSQFSVHLYPHTFTTPYLHTIFPNPKMKHSILRISAIRTKTHFFTTSARILNTPNSGHQSNDSSDKQTSATPKDQAEPGQNAQKEDSSTETRAPDVQEKANKQESHKGWDPETERRRGEGIATD
jgi:hypothetical protein